MTRLRKNAPIAVAANGAICVPAAAFRCTRFPRPERMPLLGLGRSAARLLRNAICIWVYSCGATRPAPPARRRVALQFPRPARRRNKANCRAVERGNKNASRAPANCHPDTGAARCSAFSAFGVLCNERGLVARLLRNAICNWVIVAGLRAPLPRQRGALHRVFRDRGKQTIGGLCREVIAQCDMHLGL